MSRPDIHSLLAIAMHVSRAGETTPAKIAAHLGLDVDSVIDGLWTIHMAETNIGRYYLDLDIETTEVGDTDQIEPDSRVALMDHRDVSHQIYLTAGETIVALDLLDQILGVLPPDSDEATSLGHVRDHIGKAAGEHRIKVGQRFRSSVSPLVLDAVWQALREKRELTVTYDRPDGAGGYAKRVTLKPASLKLEDRNYLACLSGKKDVRWYRLDRMSQPELGAPLSAEDLPRLERVSKKAVSVVPAEGQQVTFVAAPRARWVSEMIPSSVTGTDLIRITVTSTSTSWLRSIAVLIGTDLHDIEPAEVKAEIVGQIREILEVHR